MFMAWPISRKFLNWDWYCSISISACSDLFRSFSGVLSYHSRVVETPKYAYWISTEEPIAHWWCPFEECYNAETTSTKNFSLMCFVLRWPFWHSVLTLGPKTFPFFELIFSVPWLRVNKVTSKPSSLYGTSDAVRAPPQIRNVYYTPKNNRCAAAAAGWAATLNKGVAF